MRSGLLRQHGTCVNTNYSSGFYRNNKWCAPNTVVTSQNKLRGRVNYLIHLRNGANKNDQNNRHKNHENDEDQRDMFIHTNKGVEIVRLKNYVGKEEENVDKSKYERVLSIKDRISNVVKRAEQPMSMLLENERKREKEGDAADGEFFYVKEVKKIGDNQSIRIDEKEIVISTASDNRIPHHMVNTKEKKLVSLWDEVPSNETNKVCKWECTETEKKKFLQVPVMNKEINKHTHRTWINRKNDNYTGNHLNHHINNESSCKGNGNHRCTSQEVICTNTGSNCGETTSSEEYEDTSAWELKRRLLLKKVNMSNIVKKIRSVIRHDYEEATANIVEEINVMHPETQGDKKNLSESLDSVMSESVDDDDNDYNSESAESLDSLDSNARREEIMDKSEIKRNAFVAKLEKLRMQLLNDRKVTCKENFIKNDMKENFQSDDQSNDSIKHPEEMNDMNYGKNILKEPTNTFEESNKQMREQEIEDSNLEVIKEKLTLNEEERKDSRIEILLNFIKDNGKTNETNMYNHLGEPKSSIICRKVKESDVMKPLETSHSYLTETIEHRSNTLLHRERERNNAEEFEDNYNLCDQIDFPCIKEKLLTSNNNAYNKDSTNIRNVPLEKYRRKENFNKEFSGGSKEMRRKVVDTKDNYRLEPTNEADRIKQRNEVRNSKQTNCSTNNKKTQKRNKKKKKNMKKNRFCHINNVHIQNINIYINNDDKNKGVTVHMDGISKQNNNEETNSNDNKSREEKNKLKNPSEKIVVESSENEHGESVYSHLSELDNKV